MKKKLIFKRFKIPENLELRDYVELLINNSNLTPKHKEIVLMYIARLREGCC